MADVKEKAGFTIRIYPCVSAVQRLPMILMRCKAAARAGMKKGNPVGLPLVKEISLAG